LFVSVFLFSLFSFSFPWVIATNGVEAILEIAEAEKDLGLTYDAVLEAEEAGANVTSLLDLLNVAEDFLAEAYVFVRLGDSEGAVRLAGFCVEIVDDVGVEAVSLREEATRSRREVVLVNLFSSVAGVVIVVVVGFLLWGFFKGRYYEKVLKMKPELDNGEA
jgi:hypothetical protein